MIWSISCIRTSQGVAPPPHMKTEATSGLTRSEWRFASMNVTVWLEETESASTSPSWAIRISFLFRRLHPEAARLCFSRSTPWANQRFLYSAPSLSNVISNDLPMHKKDISLPDLSSADWINGPKLCKSGRMAGLTADKPCCMINLLRQNKEIA